MKRVVVHELVIALPAERLVQPLRGLVRDLRAEHKAFRVGLDGPRPRPLEQRPAGAGAPRVRVDEEIVEDPQVLHGDR